MSELERIRKRIKSSDHLYIEKVRFITHLLDNPDVGYIIDRNLVEWAKCIGLKPELNCQDRTSWWTCNGQLKNGRIATFEELTEFLEHINWNEIQKRKRK